MTGSEREHREQSGQTALSQGCRVVQSPGILAAPGDGELLLVREATSDAYALRGSGIDIWEAAREPVPVGDISGALARIYAVDPETCRQSVLRQVEELLAEGLFRRAT